MKRKDFYLFRHGETEYNRLGLRQGQGIDAGLNETGRLQAQKLAVYLEEKEIDIFITYQEGAVVLKGDEKGKFVIILSNSYIF